MRTLEIADAEVMQVAIRQEIDRSEESRYDHRLHGVLLVASGQSCTAVSQVFGEDATTVPRWGATVRAPRFCRVLRDGERPGRPKSVDAWQGTRLARDLRRDPRRGGHAQPSGTVRRWPST